MRLIATKECKYQGVLRKVGDEFECADKDVKMFVGFRKARHKYQTRTQEPEEQKVEQTAEAPGPRLGRYKRRDMVPEQP